MKSILSSGTKFAFNTDKKGEIGIVEKNELLSKNHEIFIKMNEIAKKQEKMASKDNLNAFLDLSKKREQLQRDISSNIRDYRKRAEKVNCDKAEKRPKRPTEEISKVIESIRETDRRIEEILFSKKEILLADIRGLRKSKKALKGYEGNRCKNPRFLDRLG